jgi:hypothetical protein
MRGRVVWNVEMEGTMSTEELMKQRDELLELAKLSCKWIDRLNDAIEVILRTDNPELDDLSMRLMATIKVVVESDNGEVHENGENGYWCVDGIRHTAVVKAASAEEAVKKAIDTGAVGSWESPDAEFIGKEMPDVYGCRGMD